MILFHFYAHLKYFDILLLMVIIIYIIVGGSLENGF